MKMIISAGGTGGHIYPALAIIEKLKKEDKNCEILYIGTHNRMECEIIPKRNIKYESIKIYGFSKKDIIRDIKNCKYIINSYHKCLKIMKEFKPDIVVGVGGYVTLPVLMAAKKLKIKTMIHEQNSIPGKTNLFLANGVDAVCVSFENSVKYFKKGVNVIYTANPCQDNVLNLKKMNKESLGFSKDKKLLVITSGSLGSGALNKIIIEFLKNVKNNANYEVLFITGKSYYDDIVKNNKFPKNIKVVPYLDDLVALFKSTDLLIARAGAGTIAELKASYLPSILVPSPNVANNHQYYNALSLMEDNMAIMYEEKDLTSDILYERVENLLKNNSKEYMTIKNNLKSCIPFNSSAKIYEVMKELVNNEKI